MEIFASIMAAVCISSMTFVLEDVIKNFAAGLFIMRERRFVQGNIVAVEGIGDLQIVEIGRRSSLAVDVQTGLYTAISNIDLVKNTVRNYSRTDWYYVRVEVPFPNGTDFEELEGAVAGILDELDWAVFGVEPKVELLRIDGPELVMGVSVPVKPTRPRHEWESMLRKSLYTGLAAARSAERAESEEGEA